MPGLAATLLVRAFVRITPAENLLKQCVQRILLLVRLLALKFTRSIRVGLYFPLLRGWVEW